MFLNSELLDKKSFLSKAKVTAESLDLLQRSNPKDGSALSGLVTGIESSIYDTAVYQLVDEAQINGHQRTPINEVTLASKLAAMEQLVRTSPTNAFDIEDLSIHIRSLRDVLTSQESGKTVVLRVPPIAVRENPYELREMSSLLMQLAQDKITSPAGAARENAVIKCDNWTLSFLSGIVTLHQSPEESIEEVSVTLDIALANLDACQYILDQCFSPALISVYAGLLKVIDMKGLRKVDRESITAMLEVIEFKIPAMAYSYLNRKIPLIHQYLRATSDDFDLTSLYRLRSKRSTGAGRGTKLLAGIGGPMPDLGALVKSIESDLYTVGLSLEDLDVMDGILNDFPIEGLEDSSDEFMSEFEKMESKVERLKALRKDPLWKDLGESLESYLDEGKVPKSRAVKLSASFDPSTSTSIVFGDSANASMNGFLTLKNHVGDAIAALEAGLESFDEGMSAPFEAFDLISSSYSEESLPYGLSIEDGIFTHSTEASWGPVTAGTYNTLCASIESLYEGELLNYRERLSQLKDSLLAHHSNDSLESYRNVQLFIENVYPLFEESLEDFCCLFAK